MGAVNAPTSLPLSQLLTHAATAVQSVRAGRSLDDALAVCPAAARPGAQALAF
ncbi:MAG TPA: 16S rRNA (cytosine(967)-C(5))-methyltransferase RsmB, partial [Piscinibacter sp.]|nr:16S rRNA (cytosine(967)-C(5))-methyltransferase RsmB [Piscinibacter sp.]